MVKQKLESEIWSHSRLNLKLNKVNEDSSTNTKANITNLDHTNIV